LQTVQVIFKATK